jgi:imidazolonepropionase-like amidohydrolase
VADAKDAKLRDVTTVGARLSFRADLAPLGRTGTGRFSLRPMGDTLGGRLTLPDGTGIRLALVRTGDAAPERPGDDRDMDEHDGDAAEEEGADDASFATGSEDGEDDDEAGPDPADAAADPAPVSRRTFPNVAYGLATPPGPQERPVVIRGATLWTAADAGVLENADLLLLDGRIAAIGEVEAPRDAVVIEGAGMHVTPGLIDEHSHLAIARGVNEGTHAVTSEVRIGDVIDPDDIGIYRALAGGVTAAQLLHGSANPIGGQAQVIKMRWGAGAEDLKFAGAPPTIKFALGENVKQSNRGREFRTRYPQTRMGVESLIRDAFLAARDHRATHEAYAALDADVRATTLPPRPDLRLDALAEILASTRFIHCHSYVQSEILMLMRLAEELGFRIQTFTHILEGYKVADEMAAHGAMASSFSDWWAYKFEVYDAIPYNTCLMHDAGVVVSVNSDSGEVIRRLNQEAGKSVLYCGLDPHEALKFVTLNPARQLRIDDRVGSLEVGKDADVVLWNGPPLSMTSRVRTTWVDGVVRFDRGRDAEERAAISTEREALVRKALTAGGTAKGDGTRGRKRPRAWDCDDVEDVWRD